MSFVSSCLSEKFLFHLHFSLSVDCVGPIVILRNLVLRLNEIEAFEQSKRATLTTGLREDYWGQGKKQMYLLGDRGDGTRAIQRRAVARVQLGIHHSGRASEIC